MNLFRLLRVIAIPKSIQLSHDRHHVQIERLLFQGIPSVEVAANGRLWATWYGGGHGEGPDNYVMLSTSPDGGATWSGLKLVIDPPHRASEPALWHDPRGVLWLIWNEYPKGLRGVDSRMWAITTRESGREDPV